MSSVLGPEALAEFCLSWSVGAEAGTRLALDLSDLPGEVPAQALLVMKTAGWWQPLWALGPLSSEHWASAWAWLRGTAPALLWGEELEAPWEGEGLQAFERHSVHQDLTRLEPLAPSPPGLRPLASGDLAEVAALISAAHPGDRADDLFLAAPHLPTPQGILEALEARWGEALVTPGSTVAEGPGGRLWGAVLMLSPEAPTPEELPPGGEAFLWDLAVAPEARRLGLGRQLVASAQRGLLAAGLRYLSFGTTEANSAVHRLYPKDSIVAWSTEAGACWWPGFQPR